MDNHVYCDEAPSRQAGNRSTSALNIDDVVISTGKNKRTPPHKRKRLPGLVIGVFVFLSILFTILFVFFYIKYKDGQDSEDKDDKVCTTTDCVKSASILLESMDPSSNPCQDFSQFACGGFYKNTIIPDAESYISVYSRIGNKNAQVFRLILEGDDQANEKSYVKKMRQFYKLCLDTDTINDIGLQSYLTSKFKQDWPTLNPAWNSSTFDLSDLIAKYESFFPKDPNLFSYTISPDLLDSTKNVLTISQPYLNAAFSSSSRNDTTIMAFQQNYVDVAWALGADDAIAQQDAKDFVDLEIGLAKISIPPEDSKNKSKLYNPMTLHEMAKEYPPIDWQRVVQEVFKTGGVQIHPNMTVINKFPSYLTQLQSVINNTSPRVLQNLYAFHFAAAQLENLTPAMREASRKLNKYTKDVDKLPSRWRQCVDEVQREFAAGLAKQFVSRTFSQRSKEYLENLTGLIKTGLRQQMADAEWMGEETKKTAFKKLDRIKNEMGYPSTNFDESYIDNIYTNLTVFKGNFEKTRSKLRQYRKQVELQAIMKKVDNSNWQGLSTSVNLQNVNHALSIRYYAGLLQPNFFSEAYPSSVNFGSIGCGIGHELTHFFDDVGSQYDERGNVRNWWQPADLRRFQKKIKCLVDQYSGFQVPEISANINGNRSVGENTADNGGLKAAYRSYKQFSAHHDERPLPGLGLSLDQQFFLAYGQSHCSKHTVSDLEFLSLRSVHLPGKYRMLGTLMNNVDFSKAFHCPAGSPMNPPHKCQVW